MRSLFFMLICAFTFTTASAQLSVECVVDAKIPCFSRKVGALSVNVKNGTPPYQYTWSNPKLQGRSPRNIAPGTYTVSVKDAGGKTGAASVTLQDPPQLFGNVDKLDVSHKEARDGRATITANGGTPPYAYEWFNDADTRTVIGLAEGQNYTVTIIDKYNCRSTIEFDISAPAQEEIPEIAIETAPEPTPAVEPEPEPQAEPEPTVSIEEVKPETIFTIGQVIQVEKLFFKANMADIKEESYPVLDEIYTFLVTNKVIVEIGGHTNNVPNDEFCFQLSNARAKTVAEYLYERGIAQSQISYKGYGKTQPIADNSTYEGRERNQRVEIKILSIE